MKRRIRILLCWLLVLTLPLCASAETELNDDEITELLRELSEQQNGKEEFLVLPDSYEEPPEGLRGIFDLLIVGVDTNNQNLRGRSDTMLLARLNMVKGTLKLVSFMRDTYVAIPGKGHNKLNAAYSYGGAELLKRTLEENFGVIADGYLAVDFSLMADLTDAIGGVELTVSEKELKSLNGILEYYNYLNGIPEKEGRLESSGTQLLTGKQAMSYARIRKIDSDFERVERQQRTLSAIFEKMLSLDPAIIAGIALEYIDRVGTDVTMAQALELLPVAMALDRVEIETLRIPYDGAYSQKLLNGTYYIVPNYQKNTDRVAAFLRE